MSGIEREQRNLPLKDMHRPPNLLAAQEQFGKLLLEEVTKDER